jgi:tetratricopeptide (TPR) repeat protein
MRVTGWMLAMAIVAAPALARADYVLDHPHQILGEGVSLVVRGHFADAEKKLREALRENPTLREGHYNLGVALRELGRNDEAINEFVEADSMFARDDEPNRAKCLYGIGLAKEARGDKDAWNQYIAFARPLRDEQRVIPIADEHAEVLNGVRVPGTQKAAR